MGDVVDDPHGEMIFRGNGLHVVIYGFDHGRIEFLGGEPVTAADDPGPFAVFHKSGADILVQGFADGTGFLGPVNHRQGLHGRGQRAQKFLDVKGSVQPYFYQA